MGVRTKKGPVRLKQTSQVAFAASSFSSWFLDYMYLITCMLYVSSGTTYPAFVFLTNKMISLRDFELYCYSILYLFVLSWQCSVEHLLLFVPAWRGQNCCIMWRYSLHATWIQWHCLPQLISILTTKTKNWGHCTALHCGRIRPRPR